MKFKPNQTRTYDREGFKKRAACLCFRSEQEDEVSAGTKAGGGAPSRTPCTARPAGRGQPARPELETLLRWSRQPAFFKRSISSQAVLLVSSSRYPDQWIVPGGGMEPEEEPGGAAVREVYEEVR
ncbi:hypothetical protein NN561_007989 [Cricetulus griseus]